MERTSWSERVLDRLLESSDEALQPMLDRIDAILREGRDVDPFQRDPEFVASLLPLFRSVNGYFGTELRGWERVPKGEPVLFVANHSGGVGTFDPVPLMTRWIEARGSEAPLYGLGYDLLFGMPRVGPLLRRMGVLPASHRNAARALSKGASVLVFPGGDYEVFRPWRDRNKILFGGRMGFIELAIRQRVRVVPVTIHGAHESTFVLTRGHRFATRMGMDRLKVKVFPVTWNLPFGVTPAFVPSLPLPAKITVEIGHPIDWSDVESPPDGVEPENLQACYDEISERMQTTMDRLAAERPYPLLTRLDELRPSRLARGLVSRLTG